MPITVQWDNDRQDIIRYVVEKDFTWEELFAAQKEAITMASVKDHIVDVLFIAEVNKLPSSFTTNLKGIANRQINNAGISVIVTNETFFQTMITIAQKIDQNVVRYMHSARTLDEAYQMIEQVKKARQQNTSQEAS